MRYDPDHKARTRDRVLDEAARLIRRDGAERLGVAALMQRVGLTHGGFYAHFSSRDELLSAAVDRMFAARHALLAAYLDDPDPRRALGRLVRHYLSAAHREARESGCPLPLLAAELDRLPPAARARYGAGVERLITTLESLLASAGADDIPARAASATAEMVGALGLARALPDGARAADLLAVSRASVARKLALDPDAVFKPASESAP